MLKSFLYSIKTHINKGRKLFLLLFILTYQLAIGQTTFNVAIDSGWFIPVAVINYDTMYRVIGSGESLHVHARRLRISDFDTNGVLLNERFFGNPQEQTYSGQFGSASLLESGNIAVGGTLIDSSVENIYPLLMLLDSNGDSLRFVESVMPHFQFISQMKPKNNSKGFVSVGHNGLPNQQEKYLLIDYDSLGNHVWDTTYGTTTKKDQAKCIEVCSDGGYLIGGWTNSYGVPSVDDKLNIWLIKTDSTGQIEWEKVLGDSLGDCAYSIVESKYGGYYVAGCYTKTGLPTSNLKSYSSPYIVKLDVFGNIIWEKTFIEPSYGTGLVSLIELANGDLIGCGVDGRPKFNGDKGRHGLVIKIDSAGNELWQRSYEHPSAIYDSLQPAPYSGLNDIKLTKDGGIITTGLLYPTFGGTHGWLLKLDSMGCLTAGCDTLKDSNDVSVKNELVIEPIVNVFPNPASQTVSVSFTGYAENRSLNLKVISLQGTEVLAKTSTSEKGFTLDVSDVSNGLYLLYVSDNNNATHVKKLLVQH
ncbi:MAG: T9SS type A sorting domain-containing protein [Salibacteraceae bacterium]